MRPAGDFSYVQLSNSRKDPALFYAGEMTGDTLSYKAEIPDRFIDERFRMQ